MVNLKEDWKKITIFFIVVILLTLGGSYSLCEKTKIIFSSFQGGATVCSIWTPMLLLTSLIFFCSPIMVVSYIIWGIFIRKSERSGGKNK
jgi:hypothetical protein